MGNVIPTPAELAAMRLRFNLVGQLQDPDIARLLAAVEALQKERAEIHTTFYATLEGNKRLRAQVEALQLKLTKRQGGPCIIDAASCQSAGRCEAEATNPAPEGPTHE